MDLTKRFLKYVSFDTQSDEDSTTYPTSKKQLDLAKYLVNELKSLGITNAFVDEYGIVYASIESNVDYKTDTIGLIAHMDTSPDCSGKDIKPRIITNYDGNDIILNENRIMKVSEFSFLKDLKGEDLIVTDGNTLLGADDKAGIAIIIETLYRILSDKNYKHGNIKIAFTPDEEVGKGTDNFDIKFFDSDYAYTLDGGDIRYAEYENFNAASVKVEIEGVNIHPGSAKDKMVNALMLARKFDSMLPQNELPELTSGYEGFHLLNDLQGEVGKATLKYIVRNHDINILRRQIQDFYDVAAIINKEYKKDFIKVYSKDSYYNMKEVLKDKMYVIDKIKDAYNKVNLPLSFEPIRGGTDGARLSYEGLPTPNLGTGGYNFHGPFEMLSITQSKQMVKILLEMLKVK